MQCKKTVYCKSVTNLSISENFNRMPVAIAQRYCRRWLWNHHFSITETESKTWIATDEFYGHEIFLCWRVWDWPSIKHQLTAGGRRCHELKTQLVSLIRVQRLQYHISIVTSERHLRLLAARTFKTDWAWTAANRHINVAHVIHSSKRCGCCCCCCCCCYY